MKAVLLDDLSQLLDTYRLHQADPVSIIGLPDVGEAAANHVYFCVFQNVLDVDLLVGIVCGRTMYLDGIGISFIMSGLGLQDVADALYAIEATEDLMRLIASSVEGLDICSDFPETPHHTELSDAAAASPNPLYAAMVEWYDEVCV